MSDARAEKPRILDQDELRSPACTPTEQATEEGAPPQSREEEAAASEAADRGPVRGAALSVLWWSESLER